jgi:rare lipoprotein A
LSGIASYYADEFNGRTTANGETFNMNDLTAAHRTLPFNTLVRVKNLQNSNEVTVRINDRGPFVGDRVIDLSLGAAKKLGMIGTGTAPVTLEIIGSAKKEG